MNNLKTIRQGFFSWCLFMAIEFPFGAFRHAQLEPRFPLIATEVLGLVTGLFFACIVAYFFLHKGWFPVDRPKLYLIGALWILLTVGFEFFFFGVVAGQDLKTLVTPYRIGEGRLFLFGLLALLFVPMAVAQRNRVID